MCYLPCKLGCQASTTPPGLGTQQAVNLPPTTLPLQRAAAEHRGAVLDKRSGLFIFTQPSALEARQ